MSIVKPTHWVIKSPQLVIQLSEKLGYDKKTLVSLLLVAKKIFARFGLLVTKKEMLDVIYQGDKDLGSIISILIEVWYKTNDEVDSLIKDIQRIVGQSYCTIEIPEKENTSLQKIADVVNWLEQQDIFVEKNLSSAWLHIMTDNRRYSRDIDDDLDSLLHQK